MTRPPYFVTSPNPPSTEPGTVLFETPRLVARRPRPSDAAATAAAADFPAIAATLRDGFPSPYTTADAEDFFRRTAPADDGSASFPRNMLLWLKPGCPGNDDGNGEERVIGSMGCVYTTDVGFRTWELGYWFTPGVARNGYGLEAVRALVDWVFKMWPGLNRLEAEVFEGNEASAGLLRKAGFADEGIKRGAVCKGGKILDVAIMGMTRNDL